MSSAAPVAARPAIVVLGTGAYTPEKILTNADLERMVETSDEWIMARTGIRERRICAEGEITSDMATAAARVALEDAGLTAADVDLILVATATPDMFFPSTGCVVQAKLGVPRGAACMDLSAACSGFLYAMEVARQMLAGGAWRTALVIGVDKLSAVVDWTDRNTCVLFGDGAGAAVLRRADDPDVTSASRGILSSVMGCDGTLGHILNGEPALAAMRASIFCGAIGSLFLINFFTIGEKRVLRRFLGSLAPAGFGSAFEGGVDPEAEPVEHANDQRKGS